METQATTADNTPARDATGAYHLHAMTVPCFVCGAAIGQPCTTTLAVVPGDACRVHVTRAIAADGCAA